MANKNLEKIAFYAKRLVAVPSGNENNMLFAGTALKNLSDLGFTLDEIGVQKLSSATKNEISTWYYETAETLKNLVGGNHEYHPFYPNFPHEIIEKSEYELFVDQIKHYWSTAIDDVLDYEQGTSWSPEGTPSKTKSLEEHPLRVLETIDSKDEKAVEDVARDIFKSTLRSKNSLSNDDLVNIVNAYTMNVPTWVEDATVCENRKTLSYLYAKALCDKTPTNGMPSLVTNDYLRIARIASYMQKNLYTNTLDDLKPTEEFKVGNLPRSMRRFIANGIEEQKNLEEDMARDKQAWKALLQKIHIGEFTQCERTNAVAHKIRNNIPLDTFYSRIEQAFSQNRYDDVIKMYRSRPGEFIKNFNRMLNVQIDDTEQKVAYAKHLVTASKDVFSKTRPEDLINFVSYLNSRMRDDRLAVHNIKGKLYLGENKYSPIPEATAKTFIQLAEQGIVSQINNGKSLGKVYIESGLEKMALPKTQTSGTQSLNAYTQGSRLPIESENGEPKNVRFLLWFGKNHEHEKNWNNIIDISASFFKSEDGKTIEHLSDKDLAWYSSRKNGIPGCYFSGDWIGAGDKGSCEFIDVDLQELKKVGVSHVMLYVNIWSGPESFSKANLNFGWQERSDMMNGEHVDLSAVRQYSELNGDARGIVPVILDVNAGEVVWTDVLDYGATANSNMRRVIPNANTYLDLFCKGDRMDMKRGAELLVQANGGTIVDNPEEADTLFTVSPYEAKSENQVVHTATDQSFWIGAIAPQKQEESIVEKEVTQIQKPIDIAEMSIADVIANYDGVIASQQEQQIHPHIQEDNQTMQVNFNGLDFYEEDLLI